MYFCRHPRCPRLYCSTDGVRKHARKAHRRWLEAIDAEMDAMSRGRKRSENYCDARELTADELEVATNAAGTCKRPRHDPEVPAALSALAAQRFGGAPPPAARMPPAALARPSALVRQDSDDSLGLHVPDARSCGLNLRGPTPVDFASHEPAHKPLAEVPQEEHTFSLWKGLPPVKRSASLAEINNIPEHELSAALSLPTTPAPSASNDVIEGWWL